MKPIIAIVGHPNVGKSTLFNRLARGRKAIVEDQPGVTRDRNYAETHWDDHPFILIDTGGFEPEAKDKIQQQIREQVEVALEEADLILFLMDGKEGLNPIDDDITRYLRKITKPVFYVINKIDGERHEEKVADFYRLGLDPLFSISAEHGRGVGDLMDEIAKSFPPSPAEEGTKEQEGIRVALVGRPNVGKSSLLNKLIGQPRTIVDSTPGTTRDSIDTFFSREGKNYIFVDTAGIRRKSKTTARLEKYCAIQALKSIERCNVVLIVLDGYEGLTEQDARIAEYAAESGRAMVFIVNKWDLVGKDTSTTERYQERIHAEAKTLDFAPILFVSALTGQRVAKIFNTIEEVFTEHRKRVSTGELNQWLQKIIEHYPPPLYQTRRVKLYYISQVRVAPPTFILFVSQPKGIEASYQRYLIHQLRKKWGFGGTPIRLFLRGRKKESPGKTVHGRRSKAHSKKGQAPIVNGRWTSAHRPKTNGRKSKTQNK